jgi:hypothetical protein
MTQFTAKFKISFKLRFKRIAGEAWEECEHSFESWEEANSYALEQYYIRAYQIIETRELVECELVNTKHTPGPWTMLVCDVAAAGSGTYICRVDSSETSGRDRIDASPPIATAYANARLIAAAPDLAEVVQMLVAECGEMQNQMIDMARAALAKAGL